MKRLLRILLLLLGLFLVLTLACVGLGSVPALQRSATVLALEKAGATNVRIEKLSAGPAWRWYGQPVLSLDGLRCEFGPWEIHAERLDLQVDSEAFLGDKRIDLAYLRGRVRVRQVAGPPSAPQAQPDPDAPVYTLPNPSELPAIALPYPVSVGELALEATIETLAGQRAKVRLEPTPFDSRSIDLPLQWSLTLPQAHARGVARLQAETSTEGPAQRLALSLAASLEEAESGRSILSAGAATWPNELSLTATLDADGRPAGVELEGRFTPPSGTLPDEVAGRVREVQLDLTMVAEGEDWHGNASLTAGPIEAAETFTLYADDTATAEWSVRTTEEVFLPRGLAATLAVSGTATLTPVGKASGDAVLTATLSGLRAIAGIPQLQVDARLDATASREGAALRALAIDVRPPEEAPWVEAELAQAFEVDFAQLDPLAAVPQGDLLNVRLSVPGQPAAQLLGDSLPPVDLTESRLVGTLDLARPNANAEAVVQLNLDSGLIGLAAELVAALPIDPAELPAAALALQGSVRLLADEAHPSARFDLTSTLRDEATPLVQLTLSGQGSTESFGGTAEIELTEALTHKLVLAGKRPATAVDFSLGFPENGVQVRGNTLWVEHLAFRVGVGQQGSILEGETQQPLALPVGVGTPQAFAAALPIGQVLRLTLDCSPDELQALAGPWLGEIDLRAGFRTVAGLSWDSGRVGLELSAPLTVQLEQFARAGERLAEQIEVEIPLQGWADDQRASLNLGPITLQSHGEQAGKFSLAGDFDLTQPGLAAGELSLGVSIDQLLRQPALSGLPLEGGGLGIDLSLEEYDFNLAPLEAMLAARWDFLASLNEIRTQGHEEPAPALRIALDHTPRAGGSFRLGGPGWPGFGVEGRFRREERPEELLVALQIGALHMDFPTALAAAFAPVQAAEGSPAAELTPVADRSLPGIEEPLTEAPWMDLVRLAGGPVSFQFDMQRVDGRNRPLLHDIGMRLRLSEEELFVRGLRARLFGGNLEIGAQVRYEPEHPLPLAFLAQTRLAGLETAEVLEELAPAAPPYLETEISVISRPRSRGRSLFELLDNTTGDLVVRASGGTAHITSERQLARLSQRWGILTVEALAQFFDQQRAFKSVIDLLETFPLERLEFVAHRRSKELIVIEEATLASTDFRLTGKGTLQRSDEKAIWDYPLDLAFTVEARNEAASTFGLLLDSGGRDPAGFRPFRPPLPVKGTLSAPDSDPLVRVLASQSPVPVEGLLLTDEEAEVVDGESITSDQADPSEEGT